ncbi:MULTISPECIES: FHA domain-containing protein [Corallococcus]|uniref:FHA domain-containing protein n=1 Tax=Corallococcus TaxID=83461 RepID=UPI000EE1B528|nr:MULTISPECIES: FHA domain-containing protein [Corallococcus]NPC68547.1 FHA domain-containing protein [Corallococcus exiguus]NPD28741.1 FHA domain-containing protein [Corallococcus exiguus]NRD43755.1 FHA domain-containing protein [Corallococcus exiguus]RKH96284.1 FHA domain-containing protein [Corallococcus sp. AB038B]
MRFEFEHLGTPTPFELTEGHHLLGGGPDDHVHLEGLPPGLLTLRIGSGRLMVEAVRSFTVNAVRVLPGVSRLVVPGEVLGLPDGMCLRVLAEPSAPGRGVGTVAVLKGLLTDADTPPSRAASLTCLTGLDVGRCHALAEACTDIGRGDGAALRLRDRAVSRMHARIRREDSGFLLEDLGTPNGVFLNGVRLEASARLADGDVVELGRSLLRFQAAFDEASGEARPVPRPVAVVEGPSDTGTPRPPEGGPRRLEGWIIAGAVALALGALLVTSLVAATG